MTCFHPSGLSRVRFGTFLTPVLTSKSDSFIPPSDWPRRPCPCRHLVKLPPAVAAHTWHLAQPPHPEAQQGIYRDADTRVHAGWVPGFQEKADSAPFPGPGRTGGSLAPVVEGCNTAKVPLKQPRLGARHPSILPSSESSVLAALRSPQLLGVLHGGCREVPSLSVALRTQSSCLPLARHTIRGQGRPAPCHTGRSWPRSPKTAGLGVLQEEAAAQAAQATGSRLRGKLHGAGIPLTPVTGLPADLAWTPWHCGPGGSPVPTGLLYPRF